MLISTIILAAEDLGPNPIAPENKELFWGAGSFLVFLFVMRVFLVPKVRKGMEARYNAIRGGNESAQAARGAAQRDVAAYEAALAEVRAEATARIDAARQTLDAERQAKVLEANARTQSGLGVEIVMMDPVELKRRYPSMRVDDLGAGVLSPRDGWCDPSGVLHGFRRKARALGVAFVEDRVTALDEAGGVVRRALLRTGAPVEADRFVIAAGAWSAPVAASIAMALPIAPMRRF